MTKSNTLENKILDLLFRNNNFANVGDAGGLLGSVLAGSLYISLHTADPGEAGDQTTNETTYTSYNRVTVARSGAGFTLSTNQIQNAALVAFPQCTGGTATITHFGIGTAAHPGAGQLLYSGLLTNPLAVSNGVTPQFTAGNLTVTED